MKVPVTIESLGLFSDHQFHTNVSERLLLAPSDGCNITKKDDLQMKDALLEYLTVMSSCARTLYGLRTLRAHGMPQAALQLVFRSIALAKLLYAAPAWWGFANAGDRNQFSSVQ